VSSINLVSPSLSHLSCPRFESSTFNDDFNVSLARHISAKICLVHQSHRSLSQRGPIHHDTIARVCYHACNSACPSSRGPIPSGGQPRSSRRRSTTHQDSALCLRLLPVRKNWMSLLDIRTLVRYLPHPRLPQ
jgi:hypothetical protein